MNADHLEHIFMRAFDAKPSMHSDEIFWYHGHIQYRLRYTLTFIRGIGSFVAQSFLDVLNDPPDRYCQLDVRNWQPESKTQELVSWTAKILIQRDAEL